MADLLLTPEVVMQIAQKSQQAFRECEFKAYNVAAIQLPKGVFFANKFTNPMGYKLIMQYFNTDVVIADVLLAKMKTIMPDMQYKLQYAEKDSILVVGPCGELYNLNWDIFSILFLQAGDYAEEPPRTWDIFTRKPDEDKRIGIVIPKQVTGYVQITQNYREYCNKSPYVSQYGDIAVINNMKQVYVYNSLVFVHCFNMNVGSWSKSRLLPLKDTAEYKASLTDSLAYVTKTYGTLFTQAKKDKKQVYQEKIDKVADLQSSIVTQKQNNYIAVNCHLSYTTDPHLGGNYVREQVNFFVEDDYDTLNKLRDILQNISLLTALPTGVTYMKPRWGADFYSWLRKKMDNKIHKITTKNNLKVTRMIEFYLQ